MKKLYPYIFPPTTIQKVWFSVERNWLLDPFLRTYLVLLYIWYSLKNGTVPQHFFQLNNRYFNREKGIYSKLDIDEHIPEKWRIKQYPLEPETVVDRFPVFLKPEWGQNSNGIVRVDSEAEFEKNRNVGREKKIQYIVQHAAEGEREFELYFLRSPDDFADNSFFSVTEVINNSTQPYPINSVHNSETRYHDITQLFSDEEIEVLWRYMKSIGDFRMARVGVKSDSRTELLDGRFKIVEINLFLPMPLVLISENVTGLTKKQICKYLMRTASLLVKKIPPEETGVPIFFKKMKAHYKVKR